MPDYQGRMRAGVDAHGQLAAQKKPTVVGIDLIGGRTFNQDFCPRLVRDSQQAGTFSPTLPAARSRTTSGPTPATIARPGDLRDRRLVCLAVRPGRS